MKALRIGFYAYLLILTVFCSMVIRRRFGDDAFLLWYGGLCGASVLIYGACVWLIRRHQKVRTGVAKP